MLILELKETSMNLLTLNLESLFPDVYKEINFDNFSVQITENNLFRTTQSWSLETREETTLMMFIEEGMINQASKIYENKICDQKTQ